MLPAAAQQAASHLRYPIGHVVYRGAAPVSAPLRRCQILMSTIEIMKQMKPRSAVLSDGVENMEWKAPNQPGTQLVG